MTPVSPAPASGLARLRSTIRRCLFSLLILFAGVSVSEVLRAQPLPFAERNSPESDPSLQTEGDWVDNRWNRTDVGPFLASNLSVPGRQIIKGLSIRIGANYEGTVCFDTLQCAFYSGWSGGFLEFAPARFGLINPPRIKGKITFSIPSGIRWNSERIRYSGLRVHGERVVLEYALDSVRVLDAPWLEVRDGLHVFTRTIEIGPRPEDISFTIPQDGESVSIFSFPGMARAIVSKGGHNALAIAVLGEGIEISNDTKALRVRIPAAAQSLRCKMFIWSGEETQVSKFSGIVDEFGELESLTELIQPGPPRWLPDSRTAGRRGSDGAPFAVDTLAVPYENPWNALMFLSGIGFGPAGEAYVCTIHGDVWRVTGIDDELGDLRWKRFATGLFQPLGLQVRDGEVFVLGRDQITRLHDFNSDGEADFYENFCNLIDSKSGHSYVTGLEKDDSGNFYFVDPSGAHRVSSDGLRLQTLASGFRNPNGMGVSPNGTMITVAPQQGEWTPSSEICEIRDGGFYGYGGPKITEARPLGYDSPLCWIPHRVDNSSGSQVWVPPHFWGSLGGNMLHLLWGRCGLMLVLRDRADGVAQGAVVPLPVRFLSGPQRGVFHPIDGRLYVAGSTGWQTSAIRDGSLQRVRLTGKPVFLPIRWHAYRNGLAVTFTQPLDRATVEDSDSYAVHQWNYRYARQYGSKDWSVANPDSEGRDELLVKSARLLEDGSTLFLEIPGLSPVMQLEIKYNIDSADGTPLRDQMWLTLNRIDTNEK